MYSYIEDIDQSFQLKKANLTFFLIITFLFQLLVDFERYF